MVFNQYGGMNTEGFMVLRAMGARAGRLHNAGPMAHSVGLNSLFKRVSACIMRCQAEAVHRRRHPATVEEERRLVELEALRYGGDGWESEDE